MLRLALAFAIVALAAACQRAEQRPAQGQAGDTTHMMADTSKMMADTVAPMARDTAKRM